jgi:LmbE family N-acetylglucosaminyl deacetylase
MPDPSSEKLANTALVVAHPDDEILWFSSVVERVRTVFVCFCDHPEEASLGRRRRKVFERYPLTSLVPLGIPESGAWGHADWEAPRESPYGITIPDSDPVAARYKSSFAQLRDHLASRLEGYDAVITHNPWGEYGHEDHVQTFRAVQALQPRLGFQCWVSNYVGNRSFKMMQKYATPRPVDYMALPTNDTLAAAVKALYAEQGCWTWYGDYRWPDMECFFNVGDLPEEEEVHGTLSPLHFLKTDFPTPQTGRSTRSRWARRLARLRGRLGRMTRRTPQ